MVPGALRRRAAFICRDTLYNGLGTGTKRHVCRGSGFFQSGIFHSGPVVQHLRSFREGEKLHTGQNQPSGKRDSVDYLAGDDYYRIEELK